MHGHQGVPHHNSRVYVNTGYGFLCYTAKHKATWSLSEDPFACFVLDLLGSLFLSLLSDAALTFRRSSLGVSKESADFSKNFPVCRSLASKVSS